MVEVLVFGGTAEGRQLVEWLSAQGAFHVVACSATEYGGELVSGLPRVVPLVGPLDDRAKRELVDAHDFACIVDATHPYATHVTQSIRALAERSNIPLFRLVREGGNEELPEGLFGGAGMGQCVAVADVAEAARAVAAMPGNILLTTGTKDLHVFVDAVPDFADRLYARVLPVADSVSHARDLGLPASHVIAMQGPFSCELNCSLMRELDIQVLVTKTSGAAGGFSQKIDAARLCGVRTVIIARPCKEDGFTLEQVKCKLSTLRGLQSQDSPAEVRSVCLHPQPEQSQHDPMHVSLVGVGLGNPDTLTVSAVKAIESSELLIGAPRLLQAFQHVSCEKRALIRTDDIVQALHGSPAKRASVLFSGDVGFYSGATGLAAKLQGQDGFQVRSIPGISSVVYFCAKLLTPWQDAYLVSAHGRECDFVGAVRRHEKTFMLTGGKTKVRDICQALVQAGLGDVRVAVGQRLSYDDELIVWGTASQLQDRDFQDLAVMLVLNESQNASPTHFQDALRDVDSISENESEMRSATHSPAARTVDAPRLLVAAPASGGGKTTFSCGLMQALVSRGLVVQACKCGPDYIDPMFHREVIGASSHNLDLFFQSEDQVRQVIAEGAESCDITVIEGVMGYYDGIAVSSEASAWHVARATQTPVLLVVDGRGRARSIAAEVKGFASFRQPSCIAGVVLNRVSAALYPRLKAVVEEEAGVPVMGYVPQLDDCSLESRHLGLVTAQEVQGLRQKLQRIAGVLQETLDMGAILDMARGAPALACTEAALPEPAEGQPVIAVAYDDAFCFYYDDTLQLLQKLGARLVRFSPLGDAQLPPGTSGLYLGGGYPELHADELSRNKSMLAAVRAAIQVGMPVVAECGGFMYLHDQLEDDKGELWPLVGAIPGRSFRTPRLSRFGYVTLQAQEDSLLCSKDGALRAHEFHYWDSDKPGDAFHAQKPQSTRSWDCAHAHDALYAGYPHLCLHAQPQAAARFVCKCAEFARQSKEATA